MAYWVYALVSVSYLELKCYIGVFVCVKIAKRRSHLQGFQPLQPLLLYQVINLVLTLVRIVILSVGPGWKLFNVGPVSKFSDISKVLALVRYICVTVISKTLEHIKLLILTAKLLVNIKTQNFYSCLILTENFVVSIKSFYPLESFKTFNTNDRDSS